MNCEHEQIPCARHYRGSGDMGPVSEAKMESH